MSRRTVIALALALLAAAIVVSAAYRRDMTLAYERVGQGSRVVASPYGDIEYAEGGSGPAVLVVHGSGGGHDQGALVAEFLLGDQFRWIAPSRFGYLRSTLSAGATWDEQAHAYAALLDRLGIDRVAVLALSHGGPSALVFAVLYPERVTSLMLVSCGVASLSGPDQAQAARKGALLKALFAFDFPYWLASTLLERRLMALIGASDAVVTGLSDAERGVVERLVDVMNPASLRAAGVAFDHEAPLPGARIAAVAAPTLIVHAKDDTLQLYANAEYAVAAVANARLLAFERGGHVVMAAEAVAIRRAARAHIRSHAR